MNQNMLTIEPKYLFTIMNYMNKPIYITDKNGMILFVSDISCKLVGKKKEELIGKNVSQLEKEGIFKPSVAKIVLDKKQNVSVIQQVGEGTGVTTGHLILDENDEPKYAVTLGYDIPDFVGHSSQIRNEELESAFWFYLHELQKLKAKLVRTKEVPSFIGQSRVYEMLKETIEKVAGVETTVLITGETGVGKTLIAERIHHLSGRKDRPFIHLNCAAIPELLLESELFGYQKGAFTGANANGKNGLIKLAEKGTLFLDEIGEIPLYLQPKLLQFLQNKTYMPIGASQTVKADVRIIAATNCNLEDMVKEGKFRADLYYRLHILPIRIPPLRERKEDIFCLLHYDLEKFNFLHNHKRTFSTKVVEVLQNYYWPGNIRELENIIEQLVIMAKENEISIQDLPKRLLDSTFEQEVPISLNVGNSLHEVLESVEKRMITQAFHHHKSTRDAAKALGVTQSLFMRRLAKYAITKEEK
ncbi:sigma-54 interaction domain-containing protein [Neobacillus bataviensis]|uniref:sigma-54 interaction domain-containing protein n=1 Tax=Neobacillus bataviensis TaxID=220685 RepID=UPI001CBED26C|nr:sigma 54-interacting transcriptional regulator [Neobacillus bataviensis]